MKRHKFWHQHVMFSQIDWAPYVSAIKRLGFERGMRAVDRNWPCGACGLWKRAKVHR